MPQFAPAAAAKDGGLTRPSTQKNLDDPVDGKNAKARKYGKTNQAAKAAVKSADDVHWPKAASDEVALGKAKERKQAEGLPLKVAATGKTSPASVHVAVLGAKQSKAAGIDGPLMTVTRTDGAEKSAPVEVAVDYAEFAEGYGGSYGSRLRLVQYPACVLTTPQKKSCSTPKSLAGDNNTAKQILTAKVPAAADTSGPTPQLGSADVASDDDTAVTVFAATAGASGDQGNFGATPLKASSQWSVSNASGAFNWSYPISGPPVPGGLAPEVSLGYSSQSIDGQTASTNNQGSWIGQGFSYEPGFIERRYKPCADDGHDDTYGDDCWAGDNATISLAGGSSGDLIKDDTTGEWRISSDDFSKVEKLTGTTNGDNSGEHWKVTSNDGTQYFFGLNQLPGYASGDEETDSTWTVPVYGDDSGEPCYNATFADAYCTQAWRWNLDYVVDPHGDAMSYFYGKETNYYTQGLKTAENGKPYVRGGYLKRIDYGQRAGEVYDTKPAARVAFSTAERCIGDLTDCSAGALTDATAADWPDVPWDRNCKADTKCAGQNSPTFWTRKQLDKVTTQIRTGDSTYEDVDSWTLNHVFTDNGDGSKSLWLDSIDHTGLVGTDVSVPSVKLYGKQLPNRVDVAGDNIQPFIRFRMSAVQSESGSVLSVNYADNQCTSSNLPTPGKSTVRCYPVKWNPPGVTDPITDWFHKYVVSSVIETDLVGNSPDQVTSYTYLGDAGWRKAKADGFTKSEYLTWSDWRGYGKVRVETSDGSVSASNTKTEHVFFQGLDGDADPDGGTKTASVTASTGTSYTDSNWKTGFELETTTYDGDKIVSKSINTPWTKVTATHTEDWGTREARFIRPLRTDTYTALAAGGWRQVASTTTYDTTTGRPTQLADYGELNVADNQCTRTEYADNATKHMYAYVSRAETVGVDCATTPDRSKDVISDDETFYDDTTAVGAAPTLGNATMVKRLASHNGLAGTYQTVSTTVYDKYGRPTSVKDALGTPKTIVYTDTYGLATVKTETNALGWIAKTEYAPEWGNPVAQVDVNNKRTDMAYDGLGRLTSVWFPDRPKSSSFSASIKYTYGIRTTGPNYVRTERIENGGTTYGSEYTLYDGLLRPRQVQTDGQDGGRLIADTYYDGSGRTVKTNDTYWSTGAPSTTLFQPLNSDIDAQSVTEYDGDSRPTAAIVKVAGQEKYRTTYSYGGDRVHMDPPTGQTATTTITDARDRTVELRQYKGDKPLPTGTTSDYLSTTYGYTPSGQLNKVEDNDGTTWTYEYDQRGRKTKAVDPDAGTSTFDYDDLDHQTSITDARSNTISTVYDVLSRTKSTWQGAANTGTKLSVSTYDTVAKGELYGTYTYKNGAVYSSVTYPVLDANNDFKPTSTKYYLSTTAEPELGGTYEFNTQYNDVGTVQSQNFPAAGGLSGEAVSYQYDSLQRPTALNTSLGGHSYVSDTSYSPTNELEQLELHTGGASDKKTWLTYSYEQGTNRLNNERVDVEGASSVAYDADYTYDAGGNVTSIVDNPTGGSRDVQCFRYDNLRRMTDDWTSSQTPNGAVGTGSPDAACTADPSSSTVGGVTPYWHSYEFDNLGNRKSETSHGIDGAATATKTYTYGENGEGPHQLTKVVTDKTATATTPAVTSQNTYTYDNAGNTETRVLDGDTQTLTWDKQNDLTKVTNADGKESSYVYDATGARLLRKSASETTFYLPGMELHLNNSTKAVTGTRYYSLGDQTVAVRDSGGVTFLAGDHHGTAQLAIDAATGQTQRRRLDPFGAGRDADSSDPSKWVDDKGFVGGTNDTTSGLVTLGAREYDADTGRFISADPIIDYTDPQQINGYAYSNNNPVSFSDPDGLKPDDCVNVGVQCNLTSDGWNVKVTKTYYTYYGVKPPKQSPADYKAEQERAKAAAAKQRAIAIAKELGKIIADELGITDALDCFTTGALGACGATIANVVSSLIGGGPVTKLIGKYIFRVDKAVALGKRIVNLGKRLWGAFKDWRKSSKVTTCIAEDNSFTPRTRVLMADGTTKEIKDVDIGDKVLATDPETGKTKVETVTAEIKGKGLKHLVKITIDVDGKKGTKTASVTATDGHPFWMPELREWITATDLKAGEWLRTSAGMHVQVAAIKRWTAPSATVHNLTVSELHTYYVLAGATPVLVHNCNLAGYADSLRSGFNKVDGPFFAAKYTSPSGRTYFGHSGHDLTPAPGGEVDSLVRRFTPDGGRYHAGCAETMCLIQAEAAEGAAGIRGGSFEVVKVRGLNSPPGGAHGTPASPCTTVCQPRLDHQGISY
ncbi:polymorphic toxin-type HINT domain-containing protein [Streptomyces sp. NBC_00562]|uniref:polymorphic toxin-type HINT domain-containing protein n=1 Tax=Streptomyces sp. NBC_00562 TaxID=2975777 RepID=UPI002E811F9C|nr:polymorphic toxin-type HINT domain-containing protein [Streptomyces sp. NBC_00562]WUC22179.1 polymorphic toxin-type HINT domain-containing protein [Streptomyces sp. NBC_00562]